jgi:hypothetical protein
LRTIYISSPGFYAVAVVATVLLFLDVPVCKSVQPRIYGVSKRELVNVLCEVEANPPDVRFRWTFNNSAEMIRVPKVSLASWF